MLIEVIYAFESGKSFGCPLSASNHISYLVPTISDQLADSIIQTKTASALHAAACSVADPKFMADGTVRCSITIHELNKLAPQPVVTLASPF